MNRSDKKYGRELEKEQEKTGDLSALENVKEFYMKKQQKCENSFEYYKDIEANRHNYYNILDNKPSIEGSVYLVITSSSLEYFVFANFLYKLNGNNKLDTYIANGHTLHVVKVKKEAKEKTVVHIKATGIGDERVRRAINVAYGIFKTKIKLIVLLGICYGIDHTKQEIGNVLISDDVIAYRINFRDDSIDEIPTIETVEEFREKPNDKWLQNLSNRLSLYTYQNELHNESISIKQGKILSSNSLMSSRLVKTNVVKSFGESKPRPIGGEMEGCGVFKTNMFDARSKFYDHWLIIKSICDWGESKNNLDNDPRVNEKIKDSIQAYAMLNSCYVFLNMLNLEMFD